MPCYVYTCVACDCSVEAVRKIADRRKDIPRCRCGKRMVLDITAGGRAANGPPPGAWPMQSLALGCHPSQVRDHQKFYAEQGIHVDFSPQGLPILRDRAHRNKVLQARRAFDRDAGYGDHAGS